MSHHRLAIVASRRHLTSALLPQIKGGERERVRIEKGESMGQVAHPPQPAPLQGERKEGDSGNKERGRERERTAESSILPVEAEKRMVSARLPSVSLPFPSVTRRGSASPNPNPNHSFSPYRRLSTSAAEVFSHHLSSSGISPLRRAASNLCERDPIRVDGSVMFVKECVSDEELRAAVDLRIRTFYEFNNSCGVEDYKRLLTEREYEALKERITGKRLGFKRVACINATLPLSTSLKSAWELCSLCKLQFSDDGKDRVVVGTLDVNQCLRLADELTGKKPEGIGADHRRAYISNVCVAKELQRKGLGFALITQSKFVALQWGITDLYVHVAVDNEAAQRLYEKSGFIYENEEPAWQARFLGRPRRFLLWTDLRQTNL